MHLVSGVHVAATTNACAWQRSAESPSALHDCAPSLPHGSPTTETLSSHAAAVALDHPRDDCQTEPFPGPDSGVGTLEC